MAFSSMPFLATRLPPAFTSDAKEERNQKRICVKAVFYSAFHATESEEWKVKTTKVFNSLLSLCALAVQAYEH